MTDHDVLVALFKEAVSEYRVATEKIAQRLCDGSEATPTEVLEEREAHARVIAARLAAWPRTPE